MNIDYFTSFLETANQKSLSKASDRLNISQPALSKQIRKLEEYFDMTLLNRSTSGVELTEAGILVFNRIPTILNELASLQTDLKQMKEIRNVTIGTLPSLVGNYLPSKVIKLKEHGIESVVVIKNTSNEVYEQLKKGEIDAAIIEVMPENRAFWQKELFVEPYYAIVHSSHSLSDRESVCIEELSDEEFVLYRSNCTTRQTINNLVKELKVKTEVEFGEFLIGYVAAGGGISVLPENSAKNIGNPFVKAIPIKNKDAKRHIAMITHSKSTGKYLYSFFVD